ncbi:MAG TPA: ribosome assembly RNA-binding protein YhbY [Gammaproteobacteria bacterium]|jgi:RNA-binding protein|nr:ribosome assembly RNA-binding protein YhbY [Gammaproteobacteria bacterium]
MKSLTEKQKLHLRGLAHHKQPVVRTGNAGLTANVLMEIDNALAAHELVKVKLVADDRAARLAMIDAICTKTKSTCVQQIGHVASFYRRHPDKPKITLP